ncbi:hypothetical protein SprV_0401582000 [Sparganum proliferum]
MLICCIGAKGQDVSQGRGDSRVREPKRIEEYLLRDQDCLQSANQRNCISSQRRRQYHTHREDTLQRRPQLSLHDLRRRHRRLPQVETNADLDLSPCLHETIKAVQLLFSRKAHGSDTIPVEIYKHGGL